MGIGKYIIVGALDLAFTGCGNPQKVEVEKPRTAYSVRPEPLAEAVPEPSYLIERMKTEAARYARSSEHRRAAFLSLVRTAIKDWESRIEKNDETVPIDPNYTELPLKLDSDNPSIPKEIITELVRELEAYRLERITRALIERHGDWPGFEKD